MWDSSEERDSCSPKTQRMINQMKKLEAKLEQKLEKLEKANREGLDLVKRETQSSNTKVEALSNTREEYRQPFLHKSEGSREERHYSERSVSSRSQRRERHGRKERYVRNDREKRHERNRRGREKPRKKELDIGKVYALMWWNQVLEDIRKERKGPCESWDTLNRDL
ncbi:hypothetical protein CR513_00618, partial [Mucuna pruriens]